MKGILFSCVEKKKEQKHTHTEHKPIFPNRFDYDENLSTYK